MPLTCKVLQICVKLQGHLARYFRLRSFLDLLPQTLTTSWSPAFQRVASHPFGICFIITDGKWLFYNVSRSSSQVTALDLWSVSPRLFAFSPSCSTSAAYIFTLYLFELKSVAFHWHLPSGDFSLAVGRCGINNTCLSLKFTFIKWATAALHKPGEY